MSFKLAAPPLRPLVPSTQPPEYTFNSPGESSILLHETVEVGHEFVNRLSHVQMSDLDPDLIRIRNSSSLVFVYTTG